MHIGLIGGIGPAATEFYYRRLVQQCNAHDVQLELTIAHADVRTLLRNLASDARDQQADVFRRHVEQLAAAGAGVAAITSIAGHFCFDELEAASPLPLQSALRSMDQYLNSRDLLRVGLLGSKVAMESKLYGAIRGVEVVVPQGDMLPAVSDEYFSMVAAQEATAAQQELFFAAGEALMHEQGAEAVVLAGTDLFLAFDGASPGFEVIDSAEVHVLSLVELAR